MAFGSAYAAWEFEGIVRGVIHRGKYRSDREALVRLSALAWPRLALRLAASPARPHVPVPLGQRRGAQRGYNQAEVIAVELARAARAPCVAALARLRDTSPQANRDEPARRANVAGAFEWRGPPLAAEPVNLIDDVYTTGATALAASAALAAAGASRVDVLVLAIVL
jgi:predicted amidophosphoribosyltransferase